MQYSRVLIKELNKVPCNRLSSKPDDPKHRVMHLNQMQREEPAC